MLWVVVFFSAHLPMYCNLLSTSLRRHIATRFFGFYIFWHQTYQREWSPLGTRDEINLLVVAGARKLPTPLLSCCKLAFCLRFGHIPGVNKQYQYTNSGYLGVDQWANGVRLWNRCVLDSLELTGLAWALYCLSRDLGTHPNMRGVRNRRRICERSLWHLGHLGLM